MRGFANGLTSGWNGQLPVGACGPREAVPTQADIVAHDLATRVSIAENIKRLRELGFSELEIAQIIMQ